MAHAFLLSKLYVEVYVVDERIGKSISLPASMGLKSGKRFHIIGNMETNRAVEALAALAQETRLTVFRLLVEAGPEGRSAGSIGESLALAPATLSFHLAQMTRAGLVQAKPQGRFVIYSADFQNMKLLVAFLTENCCGGESCAPDVQTVVIERKSHEAHARARRR